MSEFRDVLEANFFGLVAITKEVLPYMREAKSGHIINISSYGGLVGQPFHDAYCSAKFAVSGFTESLFMTLLPFGVKVTLVCPGAMTTPFFDKAHATVAKEENPYEELQKTYVASVTKIFTGNKAAGIKTSQTPEEVAEVIKGIIETDKPQLMYMTSEYMKKQASIKLVDVTGEKTVEGTYKTYFGGDPTKK